MYRGKDHFSDILAVAFIWLIALALLFLVFQKFKILFQ
jgi:hypothetical protein